MQRLVDATYYYGSESDIIFNATKSQILYFDTMDIGNGVNVMLGDATLAVAHTYKYFGHVIANNLFDVCMSDVCMPGAMLYLGNFTFVLM